jgi:hypothetical protein
MRNLARICVLFSSLFLLPPLSAGPTTTDGNPISEALGWVRKIPRGLLEFDYVMTARVRLLFFWVGKDDVGGGYIRRGISKDDQRQELFQVLFGSDPAKAPRAINRWGAGTEVAWHKDPAAEPANGDDVVSSAFFGFMKSSKGKSVSEMQQELKKENELGAHQFTGILSRVEADRAVSLVVPLASDQDYNLHDYSQAEPVMFETLNSSNRAVRTLPEAGGCSRESGFLGTVAELLDAALAGRTGANSLCYVYDAQVNTLRLEQATPVHKLAVKVNSAKGKVLWEKTYEDLLQADFVSEHQATGKRVNFTILLGTRGALRGVPVQIRYQPNWWFQVVLNLSPNAAQVEQTYNLKTH